MMFAPSQVKTFALKKDKYISISIVMPNIEMKKDTKTITSPSFTPIAKTVKKIVPKNIDVEDLFNDVWTKQIILKKEEVPKRIEKKLINPKILKELEKKIQTLETTTKKSIVKEFKETKKSVKDKNKQTVSSASEVNEYLAKINALVYKYFNPPQNTQGHSVKAVIELSTLGKVIDFRILNYSANEALNKECEKIKERLLSIVFPLNPKNKSSRTIVILTSEE